MSLNSPDALKIMKSVLHDEAKALAEAADRLDEKVCEQVLSIFEELQKTNSQLVFCGVGKSGHIGLKLSATFSSLGLRSIFLHPTEALHGDLGRVGKNDAMCFLSKSGNTEEILKLIPFLDLPKDKLIALVGDMSSQIAKACGVSLDCSVEKEACINNQAPTTSSTLALAMGDALAVLFEHKIGLSKEDFASFHPGGILGKSIRMKVKDLMVDKDDCPVVEKSATLKEVIVAMTKNPLGGCAVIEGDKLVGIMVEGDIRRSLTNENSEGLAQSVEKIMTSNPITISKEDLAYDALKLMEDRERPIGILPVSDSNGSFEGFITLHSLIQSGFSNR